MKAIILMTRLPIPGATKTRLMPHLTGDACAGLHHMFLRDYARCFERVSGDVEIIIAYAPEHFTEGQLKTMPFSAKEWFLQKGNTLGERMCHVFSHVERYKPYLTLRALSWCAHAWVGYQGERMIQNAETYEKIKRYLEPSFMEKLLVRYL